MWRPPRCLCCAFAWGAVERFGHRPRITCRNAQERQGRAVRRAPALFPVTQGRDADADHQGKLALRGLEFFADALHISRSKGVDPSRLQRPAADATGLPDARKQLLECCVLHVNSSRTSLASVLSCAAVKSPCSFLV